MLCSNNLEVVKQKKKISIRFTELNFVLDFQGNGNKES